MPETNGYYAMNYQKYNDCAHMYGLLPPGVSSAISRYSGGNIHISHRVLFYYKKKELLKIYGISEKGANSIMNARTTVIADFNELYPKNKILLP